MHDHVPALQLVFRWEGVSSILKNWVFLKLLIFKSNFFFKIEYFILHFFRMEMRDVTIQKEIKVERKL